MQHTHDEKGVVIVVGIVAVAQAHAALMSRQTKLPSTSTRFRWLCMCV